MRLLAFALLFVGGCANQKEVDELKAKNKELEDKIAQLEKGGAKPGTPPADPAKEEAATKVMTEAQDALKNGDYTTAKAKIADLTTNYADTRAGKAAARMATEVNVVGTDAPPITVEKWFQGKGDWNSGKAQLVVFWEVWCPHCKKEIPQLAQDEAKYKDKGIQIIAFTKVTKSATDDKVTDFLKENNVKFPVAKEKDDEMSKAFAVTGIPAAALVKDGKVVWRGHPARLTDDLIAKLMAS